MLISGVCFLEEKFMYQIEKGAEPTTNWAQMLHQWGGVYFCEQSTGVNRSLKQWSEFYFY